MKILADAHIPFLNGIAEQFGETEYLPGNQFTHEAIKDKDILIVRTVTQFGENNLKGSNVRLICSATIGYDHIDTIYCDAHNIAWRTAPGCNASSVEQYITASLLYLAEKYNFDLKDKTIGIVGVGNVGSKVESACQKLGMRILLNDPPKEEAKNRENNSNYVDIKTVQREADIITFHTPLTKIGKHKTLHLANDIFFNSITRKPFIINTSRGEVINNQSLKKAIKQGQISGIVLDCWENEPTIDLDLLDIADIATPHIAGYSADGKWMATKISIENLKNFYNIDKETSYQPLPLPKNEIIDLMGVSKKNQLSFAVWHSYNPMRETELLKAAPEKFYWIRSNYPIRREYHAYTIINSHPSVADLLNTLGFNML